MAEQNARGVVPMTWGRGMTRRRFDWIIDPMLPQRDSEWDEELDRSEFFSVLPSLGSLVPGWLLVVPRRAMLNLTELDKAGRQDLAALTGRLRQRLGAQSDTVFEFEHGSRRAGSLMGCGVDQAHLHLVPLGFDLAAAAVEANQPGMIWQRFDAEDDPWASIGNDQEYIVIRDATGAGVLATVTTPASQWVRRLIARQIGRDQFWDYKFHPGLDHITATKRLLGAR